MFARFVVHNHRAFVQLQERMIPLVNENVTSMAYSVLDQVKKSI